MAKTFSPPVVPLIANNTDVTVLVVPTERTFKATGLRINNQNAAASRVRLWDTFTDSGGTVHSSAANPLPLFDANILAGELVVLTDEQGIFDAIGTIVAQASIGAAEPAHVSVGITGKLEP